MPSGPKKRRAERKKNETLTHSSTNPASATCEEKVVAVVAEQKPIETVYGFEKSEENAVGKGEESELVDDKIISPKKTEPNESDDVGETAVPKNKMANSCIIEDAINQSLDVLKLDSQITIDAQENMPLDSDSLKSKTDELVGREIKLLEPLLRISAEIGFHAEKQMSLAKEFSLNLSRLLEELNVSNKK